MVACFFIEIINGQKEAIVTACLILGILSLYHLVAFYLSFAMPEGTPLSFYNSALGTDFNLYGVIQLMFIVALMHFIPVYLLTDPRFKGFYGR